MTDRLFPLDEIPEVPLLREPRRAGAARGVALDARFLNDYPPEWHRCAACDGRGYLGGRPGQITFTCPDCLGMGSVKARVRLEAGHRCERCYHPYVPKGDAAMLGVEPSWQDGGWSACDERCAHHGPVRWREAALGEAQEWSDARDLRDQTAAEARLDEGPHGLVVRWDVQAQWRVLTVHHLRGDKASTSAWDLSALCQRCHLEIQAKVVMERVYPGPHSGWFRWHAAGWYAFAYLGEDLTKAEILPRLDELLALELEATPA